MVAKQLITQLDAIPVGVSKSGVSKSFDTRIGGRIVSITATKKLEGTISLASTKSDQANPLGISQITIYVDASGNRTGFVLSKGDGSDPEIVLISNTGSLTVEPPGTKVSSVPGTAVISSSQLIVECVPGTSSGSSTVP